MKIKYVKGDREQLLSSMRLSLHLLKKKKQNDYNIAAQVGNIWHQVAEDRSEWRNLKEAYVHEWNSKG